VREVKLITADDMLVERVVVTNASEEPADLAAYLFGRGTPLRERFRSEQLSVDLSGAANLAPLPVEGDGEGELERLLGAARTGRRALAPGTCTYDAIAYVIPDPGEGAFAFVALEGGGEGDPARRLPREAEVPLPDARPRVAELHLLVMAPAPQGSPEGGSPASFELLFDDGTSERVEWPSIAVRLGEQPVRPEIAPGEPLSTGTEGRARWRFLRLPGVGEPAMQLSYRPPPGRFLDRVRMEKGAGWQVPLLLAATLEVPPETGRLPVLLGEPNFHGLPVHLVLAGEEFTSSRTPGGERALLRRIHLEPGESETFGAVLAAGRRRLQTLIRAQERAASATALEEHLREYGSWFEQRVPRFTCSDPLMERAWHYRWFLARHCMLQLDVPSFSLPVFYESLHGRSRTAVTTDSTAWILSEVRWLRDVSFSQGQIRALLMQQYPDGLLPCVRIGERGGSRSHWTPAAAVGAFEVHGSMQYLKEVLPLLRRNLEATLEHLDADGDLLPAPPGSEHTGLGWMPSFERLVPGPDGSEPRLERVELASYAFASARALARGCRVLGEEEAAAELDRLADRIGAAVLEKMWDPRSSFFFPLRESDDEPIRCREVSGLYPFFAGLVPEEPRFLKALESLVDPAEFWTPYPVPTVSRSEVAATGTRRPTVLPSAEAAVIEALARALRGGARPPIDAVALRALLDAYTRLHFEGGDPSRPLLREVYDAETGLGSGPPDCFQSAYNDLLIRLVGGLVPRADGRIELHPLIHGLEHFRFQGVPYRGRLLDIAWDCPDGERIHEDTPEGYTLRVDGERVFHAPDLARAMLH